MKPEPARFQPDGLLLPSHQSHGNGEALWQLLPEECLVGNTCRVGVQ